MVIVHRKVHTKITKEVGLEPTTTLSSISTHPLADDSYKVVILRAWLIIEDHSISGLSPKFSLVL